MMCAIGWLLRSYITLSASSFIVAVILLSSQSTIPNFNAHEYAKPLRISVIIKTGASTAYLRLPYHVFNVYGSPVQDHDAWAGPRQARKSMMSPRDSIKRHFVSDHSMRLGEVQVVDVLANMSGQYKEQSRFRPYAYLHEQLAKGIVPSQTDDKFWALDKFKFISMHRYAYEQDSLADFHVAIDDDTFVFWPALIQWLRNRQIAPDKAQYIGYQRGGMAYGGAGYILSRALLDATYGSASTPKAFEDRPDVARTVANRWCGDCALGDVLGYVLGDHLPKQRVTGGGLEFVPSLSEMLISSATWNHHVLSLHHLQGPDFVALQQLHFDLADEPPTYCDVFLKLLPSFLASAFGLDDMNKVPVIQAVNWTIDDMDHRARKTLCDSSCLKTLSTQGLHDPTQQCAELCMDTRDCLSWTINKHLLCTLFHEATFAGRQARESASGWQVDRIRAQFNPTTCRRRPPGEPRGENARYQ